MKIDLNVEKEMISKKGILQHYQDIDIYRKYVDFDISIGGKPNISPFRNEGTPSFGFFIGEGNEVCFNDFKLGGGDFVKFVQMKFSLTYWEALSKIGVDFELEEFFVLKKMEKTKLLNNNFSKLNRTDLIAKSVSYKIQKRNRKWQVHDVLFWESFEISKKTLEKYRVEAIDYFFINDTPYLADKHAYVFIEIKDKVETYKIYQPFNEKFKWITNHDSSVWQGWEQLPQQGADLVITKSLKDVMVIDSLLGLPSVALQCENILPKRHVFDQLKDRFKDISLLYDNDFDAEINWGRKFADKISKDFGLVDCFIPTTYQSKDPSDLVKNFGKDAAKQILLYETLLPF
jgi:hypothetical protein